MLREACWCFGLVMWACLYGVCRVWEVSAPLAADGPGEAPLCELAGGHPEPGVRRHAGVVQRTYTHKWHI